MIGRAISAEEAEWRRQDDARTLARAEEIKADKERLAEAHIGAQEILEKEAARLKGLSKVAKNATVEGVVKKGEQMQKENFGGTSKFERTRTVRENPATVGRL